jgi:RNA polymerase sigma-70 factor (ECF subfamily)
VLLYHDGRRIAFEQTILAHRSAIQAFALRLVAGLPNREEIALEIVQESYLRALLYFSSFAGHDVVQWLRSITLNTFLTWRNKEQSEGLTFVGLHLGAGLGVAEPLWARECEDPEWRVITNVDGKRLLIMIRELPETLQRVLILREVEGLAYNEIALSIGAPIGTVMSRLARARIGLRRIWLARRAMRTEQMAADI